MGKNYLSIPRLQWYSRWSLGIDKLFHSTLHWACGYLSMKLEKMAPGWFWGNIHVYLHFLSYLDIDMMTSSNIFSVTGPLWGESTGQRWIYRANQKNRSSFLWFETPIHVINSSSIGVRIWINHYIHTKWWNVIDYPYEVFSSLISTYCRIYASVNRVSIGSNNGWFGAKPLSKHRICGAKPLSTQCWVILN